MNSFLFKIHKISHINDLHSFLNNYNGSSIESNRPSFNELTESINIPWKVQDTIDISPEVVSRKQINVQILKIIKMRIGDSSRRFLKQD